MIVWSKRRGCSNAPVGCRGAYHLIDWIELSNDPDASLYRAVARLVPVDRDVVARVLSALCSFKKAQGRDSTLESLAKPAYVSYVAWT